MAAAAQLVRNARHAIGEGCNALTGADASLTAGTVEVVAVAAADTRVALVALALCIGNANIANILRVRSEAKTNAVVAAAQLVRNARHAIVQRCNALTGADASLTEDGTVVAVAIAAAQTSVALAARTLRICDTNLTIAPRRGRKAPNRYGATAAAAQFVRSARHAVGEGCDAGARVDTSQTAGTVAAISVAAADTCVARVALALRMNNANIACILRRRGVAA